MPGRPDVTGSLAAFPETATELVAVQWALASASEPAWHPPSPRPLVAACFVCFARDGSERGWAAAAMTRGDRELVATSVVRGIAGAPYEPGLLALREGRLLEAAVAALAVRPEVVVANAGGRDHPRRAGLALHLGAVLTLPSVGVTDRPLLAQGAAPPAARGATSPLMIGGDEVARLVRTRGGARPVVVHPGWRTDLDVAVAVVLSATRRARTPEPLRRARRAARAARAADGG
jgi:deoxyribonuclease V